MEVPNIPEIRFDLTRGSRGATRRMPSKPIAGAPPIAGHPIAGAEIKITYFVTNKKKLVVCQKKYFVMKKKLKKKLKL